jgi:hypothetical protein
MGEKRPNLGLHEGYGQPITSYGITSLPKQKQLEERDTIAKMKEVYSIMLLNLHP